MLLNNFIMCLLARRLAAQKVKKMKENKELTIGDEDNDGDLLSGINVG